MADITEFSFADNSSVGLTTNSVSSTTSGTQSSTGLDEVQAKPNPLDKFQSFNCLFTLAALSPRDQNFGIANKSQINNIICRSQGDWAQDRSNKRVQTDFGTFDYFIDDVTIVSIPAFSPETGNSFATKISFKVYEPYSMGLFMLALQQGAQKAGYGMNFTEASYMFMIEFMGYVGNQPSTEAGEDLTRYIPIKFINIKFKVTEKGSVYDCEAIPYNEYAFRDQIVKVSTDIKIHGNTVKEILGQGAGSLVNQLYTKSRNENRVQDPDLIIIQFPKDFTERAGYDNEISKSPLYEDLNSNGTIPFLNIANPEVFIEGKEIIRSNVLKIDKNRVWQFTQEATIPEIITEVIIRSHYITDQIVGKTFKVDENGMVNWFRIETQIIDGKDNAQLGRQQRTIIYRVLPYKVHIHRFLPPKAKPPGYQNLTKSVVRVYDYLYTGKNTEVLNVDIDFDMAYFTPIPSDNAERVGQQIANLGGIGAGGPEVFYRPPVSATSYSNPSTNYGAGAGDLGIGQTPEGSYTQFGGLTLGSNSAFANLQNITGNPDNATRSDYEMIANRTQVGNRVFQSKGLGGNSADTGETSQVRIMQALLTNDADMIELKMDIMGDPYYIPSSGMGSQIIERRSFNELKDGSMNYQDGEVDIIIRFRTPVDLDPSTGLYRFEQGIDMWSGLYQLLQVESNFIGNKFTQKIRGTRLRAQLGGADVQKTILEEIGRSTTANEGNSSGGGSVGENPSVSGGGGDSNNTAGGQPSIPTETFNQPSTNVSTSASQAGIPQTPAPSIFTNFGQNLR